MDSAARRRCEEDGVRSGIEMHESTGTHTAGGRGRPTGKGSREDAPKEDEGMVAGPIEGSGGMGTESGNARNAEIKFISAEWGGM